MQGAKIQMDGVYSMNGDVFDFHGKARLHAHLSEMVGGWKSILLKPIDPFFAKNGAGTEVPIKVTGTRSEPHFGLDFGHHDDTETKVSKDWQPGSRDRDQAGYRTIAHQRAGNSKPARNRWLRIFRACSPPVRIL